MGTSLQVHVGTSHNCTVLFGIYTDVRWALVCNLPKFIVPTHCT